MSFEDEGKMQGGGGRGGGFEFQKVLDALGIKRIRTADALHDELNNLGGLFEQGGAPDQKSYDQFLDAKGQLNLMQHKREWQPRSERPGDYTLKFPAPRRWDWDNSVSLNPGEDP